MLSEYIDSCESIRKAMDPVISIVSETVVCTKSVKNNTSATVIRYITLTSTMRKNTRINKTNGYIIKRCKSAKFTFCTIDTDNTTCISLDATMCETTVVKCSLQEFCDKVTTNTTCKVLEEIKKECNCECNNICVGSDDICTKFINVTMDHCKKEATSLIIQFDENISPELVNTIILRFIGLQLYLRIIQEFCLLRDNFTKIIKNLSTCYDVINSCTCGSTSAQSTTGNNCSIDGKCLCTIFYKLFKAIKLLHDRYCKIIGYMKGECDVDLYKIIPSLSLTRSVIIITKYFNDYIKSDYMVEESRCGCGYNVYVKPSLIGEITDLAAEIVLWLLNAVNKSKYTGLRTCTCHRYSSKLDDVVTLLLGGIEDVDDCDGLLSDVISMMSPFVKVKDCRYGKVKTQTSQINTSITKENIIKEKLNGVNDKKNEISGVITDIIEATSCGGTTSSNSDECGVCSTTTTAEGQAATPCTGTNGGDITKACGEYINNEATTGCGDSATCECGCKACKSGNPGECCCFFKCTGCPCEQADGNSKTCLMKMVGLLSNKGINCNGNTDCLMCYLCLLKNSVSKLKTACNVTTNGDGCNLNQTLKELPTHISQVVGNICGTVTHECCNNCNTDNCCSDDGSCTCKDKKCCEVNNRFSEFTKFLLGTCTTSSDKTSNNCKTIADTLTDLNTTLGTFISGNGENGESQCNSANGGGSATCINKCCCGTENCTKDNGCTENKPINILSCVIKCGLKGIKKRSEKIVTHIDKIEKCLTSINKKMCDLDKKYDGLHGCISDLGQCVKTETDCLRTRINKLKDAKQNNQEKFNNVINTSKTVLSYICGLYRVYSIESYSYYLSPYYDPIFPHNKQFILPYINNLIHIYFTLILN